MVGLPPVLWKTLDQQELSTEPGDVTAINESGGKSTSRGIFQSRSRKRMSTAPGSTLPRPSLSDMSISSPLNVTKNTVNLASMLDQAQSRSYPHFDRKRMMRRSRSAQGLVGSMSEFRMEQKIRRKPVPRLSNHGIRTEPKGLRSSTINRMEMLSTSQSAAPLRMTAHEPPDTSTSTSQSAPRIIGPISITPSIQDPPRTFYDIRSAPTIPTTITSGSLNLGLIPSGSVSSLASSSYIDTPNKDQPKLRKDSSTSVDMDAVADISRDPVSPTRRYGALGMKLEHYMGQAALKEDEIGRDSPVMSHRKEGIEADSPSQTVPIMAVTSIAVDNDLENPHVASQATEPNLLDMNIDGILPTPPSRPHRPPSLFLDLSRLKPFAINLKNTTEPGEDLSTPVPIRMSAISRNSSFAEQTTTTDSSFCALEKDSLDSTVFATRSLRSGVLPLGREADGLAWTSAKSNLSKEMDIQDDRHGEARPNELEDLGKRLKILNEEALGALEETPRATAKCDPFDSEPFYQRSNSVIAWTRSLSAEVSPTLHSGSTEETVKGAMQDDLDVLSPLNVTPGIPDEELVEPSQPSEERKRSRGNRQDRLLDNGRASRTGYWDYSIIRGGFATPPPPEFFSTFQQTSPRTPIMESDAAFHNRQSSPGNTFTSSPLQRRANICRHLDSDNDEDAPGGPILAPNSSPRTPPSRAKSRLPESEPMTTPQRLLGYGIDVLTSPAKLLSPRKRALSHHSLLEESGSLINHAGGMGRMGSFYSSASEYDSDNSPEINSEGFTIALNEGQGQVSRPLLDLVSKGHHSEQLSGTRSEGVLRLGTFDNATFPGAPNLADRQRDASMAQSPSSNIDSLSQLDIGLRPAESDEAASGDGIAQFNNAPPVFHFPSPPPSERHQSILSMLSGASKSDTGSRGSQGALLATQMNEARKQQHMQHLSVLEPSVKLTSAQTQHFTTGTESQNLQTLTSSDPLTATPPPRKRNSAFENAESDTSTPSPHMSRSSSYATHLQTPKRLSLSAAIASHGPAISIISPDRNFPRLRSDIAHQSPQALPNASSRRDIALYPRESIDEVTVTSSLLPSSASKIGEKRNRMNGSQSYREDIRLRPLLELTGEQSHRGGSFTASSQRSEPQDELSERFMGSRWNNVYCACFGKRIC